MKRENTSIAAFYLLLVVVNFIVDISLDKSFSISRNFLDVLVPLIPTFIYAVCVIKNIKQRPLILAGSYLLLAFIFLAYESEGGGLFSLNVFVTKLSLISGILLFIDYLEFKLLLLSTLVTIMTLWLAATAIDKAFAGPEDTSSNDSN